jgi:hypothetical protein
MLVRTDVPEHSDMAQIKNKLELKRARIKEEFERRIREFDEKKERDRERIIAYKKIRDQKIARIEKSFDDKTAATLRKLLGEEDYRRLQQWLCEKKKKDLEKRNKELEIIEDKIQPTEEEDYDRQISILQETDASKFPWIYYFDHQDKIREELKRDTGIQLDF